MIVVTHFRCTPCRARLWRDGGPTEHLDDPCPGCGGPLEPVARTEELVGLQALRTRPVARATIADHVRAVIAFNDAARARAQDEVASTTATRSEGVGRASPPSCRGDLS